MRIEAVATAAALFIGSTIPLASEQYRKQVLADKALQPAELLSRYQRYDFSSLWLKIDNENVLGFIGSDYHRLRIKLLTARPDPQQPGRYIVTGKSREKKTLMPFSGTFRLLHVREVAALPVGLDGAPVPAVKAGVLLAEYELKEPADQRNAGVFRGILRTTWYLDRNGKMQYDNLRQHSDAFSNNQAVGTWQSYKTSLAKRCNWGDHRIPAAGDLDQGAGEFSPSDQYVANGWQSYRQAWVDNNAEARQKEKAQWWK